MIFLKGISFVALVGFSMEDSKKGVTDINSSIEALELQINQTLNSCVARLEATMASIVEAQPTSSQAIQSALTNRDGIDKSMFRSMKLEAPQFTGTNP